MSGTKEPTRSNLFQSCLESLQRAHDAEIEELQQKIRRVPRLRQGASGAFTPKATRSATPRNGVADTTTATQQPQSQSEPSWQDLQGPHENLTLSESDVVFHSTASDWMPAPTWDTGTVAAVTCVSNGTKTKHESWQPESSTDLGVASRSNMQRGGSSDADLEMRDIAKAKSNQKSQKRNSVDIEGSSITSLEYSLHGSIVKRMIPERFRSCIVDLVTSHHFEVFFAFVITTNSIFLGIRVNARAENLGSEEHTAAIMIEYFYTLLFTLELYLRVAVEGCMVFCKGNNFGWFLLDLSVVVSSWVEVVTDILNSQSEEEGWNLSNARMLRVIRVVRIIKIIRIARVVRFVRALRVLVLSIMYTMRSVFWAFVLLIMIVYVFALIFTQGVTDSIQSQETVSTTLIVFWGTLPRSMFTLYKSISGGISWHDCVTPLADVDGYMVALFILYVSFTIFAVLNVITGVFCEAAIESARQDYEMMIQQHLKEKKQFISAIYGLFGVDQSAHADEIFLSYTEFEDVLQDPACKAQLEVMQLDITDAWELFKLLDTDESALIDVEEFAQGFLRLKGLAKAIDVAKLSYESKTRNKRIANHLRVVEDKINIISRSLDCRTATMSLPVG